jgi:site-specific DNA-methyltransferase (adenine-specific)
MKNTVKISSAELINADCLQYLPSLPDNSIDLIVTDPPYFKVKPNGWDNQWKGDEDYLRWLDMCLAQFWRVLNRTVAFICSLVIGLPQISKF